jgi:hypothetical protein
MMDAEMKAEEGQEAPAEFDALAECMTGVLEIIRDQVASSGGVREEIYDCLINTASGLVNWAGKHGGDHNEAGGQHAR